MVGSQIVFLDSLRAYVVVAPDFNLAIGGSSLADWNSACRLRLSDPVNPVPGLSQEGDSIVPFLYRLVASSGSSPLVSLSASALRHGGVLDVSGSGLGSSLPPLCSSLSGPSPVAPLAPSVAPFPSSLPSVSTPLGFHSSSFASSLPKLSSLAPTFPVHSPSVTSVASSLPFLAPPGFPVALPLSLMAPAVGLRHPVLSLLLRLPPTHSLRLLFFRLALLLHLLSFPLRLALLCLSFVLLLPLLPFPLALLLWQILSYPGPCRRSSRARLLPLP